jgi:hypothetical protein
MEMDETLSSEFSESTPPISARRKPRSYTAKNQNTNVSATKKKYDNSFFRNYHELMSCFELAFFFGGNQQQHFISEPSQAQERRVVVPMVVRAMIKLRKMR